MHPVDEIRARLRSVGFSLGEWSSGATFVVEMDRQGQHAQAVGRTQTEAWRAALQLIEGTGVVVPVRPG